MQVDTGEGEYLYMSLYLDNANKKEQSWEYEQVVAEIEVSNAP